MFSRHPGELLLLACHHQGGEAVSRREELEAFLFSLGCYSGEPITVVSRVRGGCTVSIKDGRYNIDTDLARAISI